MDVDVVFFVFEEINKGRTDVVSGQKLHSRIQYPNRSKTRKINEDYSEGGVFMNDFGTSEK